MEKYRIIDEPRMSSISRVSANPMWPLLSVMIASPVFGWIWFIVNGLAIGSPTKLKEILIACGGIVFLGFFYINLGKIMSDDESIFIQYVDYIRLISVIISLWISYYLYILQSLPFRLHEYFNGPTMNGVIALAIGLVLGNDFQVLILTMIIRIFK